MSKSGRPKYIMPPTLYMWRVMPPRPPASYANAVFSRSMIFAELDGILLQKWLSLLQMPWLVVIWTIITPCLEVCHVSISTSCRVFRILLHISSQIIEIMLMLQSSLSNSCGYLSTNHSMFKTAILVYKYLPSGSPSYFGPSSCSTRHSHSDHKYLTVPSLHSSLYKSNTLAIVLLMMLPRFGIVFLMMYFVENQLPPSGKSSKLPCLQKPIRHRLHVIPVSLP